MSHLCSLGLAFALLAVAACGNQSTDRTPENGGPIRFTIHEISASSRSCAESEAKCARVELRSLETTGGGTEAARANIDLFLGHDLVSRMRSLLPEEVGNRINDIDELTAAFLAGHRAFVENFPDATAEWSVEISASAITSTPVVATIEITEFAYTGGAHPNTRRRLVSFDVESGQLIGVDELTSDVDTLTALAERHLRADRGLGPDDDLEAAGFWFPEQGFTLPDNLGITAEGVVFHWDAYEIAPYSMGPIDVTVPVEDLAGIIDRKYW
jgi:hypothetical protein